MSLHEVHDLLFPGDQPPLVQRRRATLIISRVRMVAAVFALLTPLWIPVDVLIFEQPLGYFLAGLRLLATLAFGALALSYKNSESAGAARQSLIWLLAIPTLFFVISHPLLAQFQIVDPAQQVIAAGYAFLPFVMLAGLSVFPITAIEGICLASPLWLAKLGMSLYGYQVLPFNSQLGALWLLGLLAVVATLAGMSQLHFMTQLVSQASHDGLTRAYTRRVGEEMLDMQFNQSLRGKAALSLAFIDLDHFKSVNDRFGHEEGDNTLRHAAQAMRKLLRRGDILIRWGGEEFLVVMPNTDAKGARIAVTRLREAGLGQRPDGAPQTASIGVAERMTDDCQDWGQLVEKADQRMYLAKTTGRDKAITCNDEVLV